MRVMGFKSCEGGVETTVVCRMGLGQNIIRRWNGTGDFEERTIWAVTEEIPVASAVCLATHMCTENDQPGPVAGRLLYCTV